MKKLIPVILCCAMLLAACGSSADSAPACRIFRGSFLCGKHHRRRGRRDRHRRER